MARVYLGLGSNIGDKKKYIDEAIRFLKLHDGIGVSKVSSYYETEPVGYEDQDIFLNLVIEINTSLGPYDLLKYCNEIENKLKRKRLFRWGPRTIDLDILWYEDFVSDDEILTIPHPRMCQRAFVMVPLYEITQDLMINARPIGEIMEGLDTKGVKKMVIDHD